MMIFSYDDYIKSGITYPNNFKFEKTLDKDKVKAIEEQILSNNLKNDYKTAIDSLKLRASNHYCQKIEKVQNRAREYAKAVFPPYYLLAPETICDDWLSMVDWHKEHPSRDHSLHQTLTAYIAMKLLGYGAVQDSLELPNQQRLLDYVSDLMLSEGSLPYLRAKFPILEQKTKEKDKEWAAEVFYETVVVAALFHDVGYPWQYISNLSKHLDFAKISNFGSYLTNGSEMKAMLSDHIIEVPFFGYHDFESTDVENSWKDNVEEVMANVFKSTHGVPGAVSFLKLNELTRKPFDESQHDEATCKLILEWASLGIMMHDMVKPAKSHECFKLNFETDPLSCIISLADVLEEFHRPQAKFSRDTNVTGEEIVKIDYTYLCNESSISFNGTEIVIGYKYDIRPPGYDHTVGEIRDYFEPKTGYIDLSSWGVDKQSCDIEPKN